MFFIAKESINCQMVLKTALCDKYKFVIVDISDQYKSLPQNHLGLGPVQSNSILLSFIIKFLVRIYGEMIALTAPLPHPSILLPCTFAVSSLTVASGM